MSARLVRQIEEQAKGRKDKPVVLYMKSGRIFEGKLGKIDAPNGTVEIKVEVTAGGFVIESWTALVATEAIEAVSPRWEEAA